MKSILRNAKVTTGVPGEQSFNADCVVIEDSRVVHIGSEKDTEVSDAAQDPAVTHLDLQGRHLLRSFFDGHVHILQFGIALAKIDLRSCKSLEETLQVIKKHAVENPKAPQLLFHGWEQSATGYEVDRLTLDNIDVRPIFVDAHDLHSCWCNSAALRELDADAIHDPPGGSIVRDKNGRSTGILEEAAVITIVWPYIVGKLSKDEKKAAIRRAIETFNTADYTSVIDMAMDEGTWNLLTSMRDAGELSLRIGAHFLILPLSPEDNVRQVNRVVELRESFKRATSPGLWFAGIKIVCDSVIDGCTAALTFPFLSTGEQPLLMWTQAALNPVLSAADAANMQCALHAIGDAAVRLAVEGQSSLGSRGHRHRIEHLELTRPEDAQRLGELGITASIQPVHCDPEQNSIWPPLIGHDACERAFAYGEFLEHGAKLAIGTDVPTAPHIAFNNIYNATTRRSFWQPHETETKNEHFKIALHEALCSISYWPAYACFAENDIGGIRIGKQADLIVVDSDGDWGTEPSSLLRSKVLQTWLGVNVIFQPSAQPSVAQHYFLQQAQVPQQANLQRTFQTAVPQHHASNYPEMPQQGS